MKCSKCHKDYDKYECFDGDADVPWCETCRSYRNDNFDRSTPEKRSEYKSKVCKYI